MEQTVSGQAAMQVDDSTTRLKQFIEQESGTLLASLRLYLSRAGLVAHHTPDELLNEVVVEALKHASRFDPARQPIAWLLGIAANLIKRKQAELAKRNRREPLARDLFPDAQDLMSDDEIFEQITSHVHDTHHNDRVNALLAGLPEHDQKILRLAVIHELSGAALAQALGVSPGAARVRLHRALNRLRDSQIAQERR
jgi:RNA polymerase sigma factor (sigma-70 family)